MIHDKLTSLFKDSRSITVSGLRGASPAWLAATVAEHSTCCCIVPDEHYISLFEQDLHLFTDKQVLQYPGHEIPPYTPLSPDQRTTAARLSTLYRLKDGTGGIMVTSIEALLRRIMPPDLLTSVAEYLMAGEDCDQDDLLQKLIYLGYDKVALVQSVGDFSVRGGIIDIFPPPFAIEAGTLHDGPIRLDFFGDTIESLRSFDPFTQRSIGEISEATLLPVTDLLFDYSSPNTRKTLAKLFEQRGEELHWNSEETAHLMEQMNSGRRFAGMEFFLPLFFHQHSPSSSSVLEFLPKDTVVLLVDPESIHQSMDLTHERIFTNYQTALDNASPALPPEMLFLGKEEVERQLGSFRQLLVTDFPHQNDRILAVSSSNHQLLKQDISLQRTKIGLLAPLSAQIFQWQKAGELVIICCRSSRHTKNLAELLAKHNHQIENLSSPLLVDKLSTNLDDGILYLCDHPLSQGFSLPDSNIHILSDSELFGEMRLGGKSKKKQKGDPLRFTELNDGDIVVHRDHGLGVYRGLSTIEFQ